MSCEDSWIERRVIEGQVAKPEENANTPGIKPPFLNPSSQAPFPKSQEAENKFVAPSFQAPGPQAGLEEDDFYTEDVSNDLESRLDEIDPEHGRMADLVIGAHNNHVSEIYSPPTHLLGNMG